MSLHEFIKKYNNKFVEAGGSPNALNQCVDLVNQYIAEILGLPKILGTDANNLHRKAGSKYTWIPNTPTNKPKNGDIIIWSLGKWGHTGIFVEGNNITFKSFDQNYPKGTPSHIQSHNYNNVLGWLRPKKGSTMSQFQDLWNHIAKNRDAGKVRRREILDIWKTDISQGNQLKTQGKEIVALKKLINSLQIQSGVPVTQFTKAEVGFFRGLYNFAKLYFRK